MGLHLRHCGDPPGFIIRGQANLALLEGMEVKGSKMEVKGGNFDLRRVRTICYTVDREDGRGGPHSYRRRRVAEILGRLGWDSWAFHFGQATTPYWIGIASGWAKILRENEPPLLMLEDDIEPRHFQPVVQPPVGCDIAYLGGFRDGDYRGTRNARAAGLAVKPCFMYSYCDLSADWMRIFGMWGMHAQLWLSKGAMNEAADLFDLRKEPIDTTMACEQWRWQVYCATRPLFIQNDGHHLVTTSFYSPAAFQEMESTKR